LYGDLIAEHYENTFHQTDPRIDRLRELMVVVEEPAYSKDYLDPEKRSIANALQIEFADGSKTEKVAVEYPIGHRRRRAEGIPVLEKKFFAALATRFPAKQIAEIVGTCAAPDNVEVRKFMDLWAIN
jgi:2-methylcitrate dehydratase